MSSKETDRKSKAVFSILEGATKVTPTPSDNAVAKGLRKARQHIRKAANFLRRRGYLFAIAALVGLSGCSTFVRFDGWLPEFVPCDPVAETTDAGSAER